MINEVPKKIACYRLLVDDTDSTEVDFISLVEDPAIQIDWMSFSNGESKPRVEEVKFKINSQEKRMLSGVFMVPDKPIYRMDKETGEEYFVVFTADDIEMAVKKFNKNSYGKNINTEHDGGPNGCYVMDSWFVRDADSNPLKHLGFNVSPGSWVGTVHVEDQAMWDDYIKTGKVKGFSVEGLFKFGKKTLIDGFKSNKIDDRFTDRFTDEELDLINKIADILLDE